MKNRKTNEAKQIDETNKINNFIMNVRRGKGAQVHEERR